MRNENVRMVWVLRALHPPNTLDGHAFDSYEEGIRWLAQGDHLMSFKLDWERQYLTPPCRCCGKGHWHTEQLIRTLPIVQARPVELPDDES